MDNNKQGIVIPIDVIDNTKKGINAVKNRIKSLSKQYDSIDRKLSSLDVYSMSPIQKSALQNVQNSISNEIAALEKQLPQKIKPVDKFYKDFVTSRKKAVRVSSNISIKSLLGDAPTITAKELKVLEKQLPQKIKSINKKSGAAEGLGITKETAAAFTKAKESIESDIKDINIPDKKVASPASTTSTEKVGIDTSKIQEATDYLNNLKVNLKGINSNEVVKLSQSFAALKESMPKEQFQMVNNEFNRLSETADGQVIPALKRIQVAYKNVTGKIKKDMKSIQGEFQGWALSVMFFGMALQRTFSTIWKSSTKTFNDVIHSVSGATTGFDRMQSSLTFLQFVAGQALEPLAEAIVPIIMWVANLIENNEKTFRTWVLWAGILGVVFSALGSLVLAFAGLRTLLIYVWGAIKGVGLVAMGLWNAFIWVKNAIILIKTIGFLDWLSTLFPKVAAITTATYGWATAKLALAKASLILAGKLAIVLAAIAAIIFLLLVWDDWLEGMKLSFKVWGVVIKHEFLSLGDRFKILGLQMKISWQGTINSLINIAEKFINGLISAYNAYATVAKKPIIPNIDLSSLKSGIMDTEKELFDLEDKLKQRIFDRDVEVYKVGKELPDVASRVTLGAALDKLMGGTKGEVPLDFSDISNMNKEIEAGVKEVSELDAAFSNLSDTLAEVKLGFSEVVGDYGGYLSELDKTQDSVFSSKDEKEIKNITNTFNISMSPQTGGQSMDEYAENIASIILEKINGA
jgi:hypothetical protein